MADMFCWYELATSDPEGAADFYARVAGWTTTPVPMGDMTYIIAEADRRVAGIMPIMPGGPGPIWFGYIAVDDVDAYADRVAAAGGQVLRAPDDIPNIGRFAPCADPQGAMFMLFKGAGDPAPNMPFDLGTPGCWGWNELATSDGEAAWTFYSGLFGWTRDTAVDMGPMGTYQTFAAGGEGAVGGMMTMAGHPPAWCYYIYVDDIDAGEARLEAAGGTVINGPMEVPGGIWIVQGTDPQGAVFAILGPKG